MNNPLLSRLIGRGLVLVFIVLTLAVSWEAFRPGGMSAWVILPAVILLTCLLLLPALMILRRHWDQLASVLSGSVCFTLFVVTIKQANRLADSLFDLSTNGHSWGPFLGLLILLCAWVLPWKLHSYLQPRLRSRLEGHAWSPVKHPAAT